MTLSAPAVVGRLSRTAVARLRARLRVVVAWVRGRRLQLECAAVLTALVGVAMTLGWLSWQATGPVRDSRGDAAAGGAEAAEATLVTDLTTDWIAERRTGAQPYTTRRRPPDAPVTSAGAGDEARSANPGAGGLLVSAAAVGAAFVPCLVAAVVVLRRCRRRASADPAADAGPRPVTEDGQVATEEDLAPREPKMTPAHVGEQPVLTPTAGAPSAVPQTDAGARVSEPSPGTTGSHATTVAPDAGDRYGATPAYESRERLFERRAAQRVAYECDGRLRGRGSDSPMRVLDLSETGLRCGSSSSALPKPTEFVVVTFLLDDGEITLTGQVSWRRATPEGHELGVQFQRVSQEDTGRLRATCLRAA